MFVFDNDCFHFQKKNLKKKYIYIYVYKFFCWQIFFFFELLMNAEPVLETLNGAMETPYSTPTSGPCSFKLLNSIGFEPGLDIQHVIYPKHRYITDIAHCSLKSLPNSIDVDYELESD